MIYQGIIYCANAGDSRAVLCRSGRSHALSKDHKPENKEEIERIKKAGGFVTGGRINGNLNLSRCIGDLEFKRNPKFDQKNQMIIAVPEVTKY